MRLSQTKILSALCLIALTTSGVFWLVTAQQPLIDQHEFRQTQTALTALFMQPNFQGILNYETPVVGAPWAIPFEFPLYQAITALLATMSPWSLSSTGRLVSAGFGLACLAPAWGLMRNFKVSKIGRLIFALLYLTSSIYLYWNRSFMIESTALILTLTSLYLYSEIRKSIGLHQSDSASDLQALPAPILIGFAVSLCLGLLVKATTSLPALLLIGVDWVSHLATLSRASENRLTRFRRLLIVGACLLASLLILKSWVYHSDSIKSLNPIGIHFTSTALSKWNYGTLQQRISPQLWSGVLIQRMLTPLGVCCR